MGKLMRKYNKSHLWFPGNAKMDVQLVVRYNCGFAYMVLQSGEDFLARGSLRFQNVIPIPTLEVKPTISCKTTLMLCRINSKINKVNGLRTILLVKTKRVFLFIPKLQGIYIVVHMHPSYATDLLAFFLTFLLLSFPLHKNRYGHSSWFLFFITNSCFFLFFRFPVF